MGQDSTIINKLPFSSPGRFFKGNLHTHCTGSDGDYSAKEVVRRYRDKGYDFLAISDHFLECYDYPVTDTRSFRREDFTTLIAAELHAGKLLNDELWHVLAVGLPLDFPPQGVDEGIAGAFIGIVHPAWYGLQRIGIITGLFDRKSEYRIRSVACLFDESV
jgi:hypothetical protein